MSNVVATTEPDAAAPAPAAEAEPAPEAADAPEATPAAEAEPAAEADPPEDPRVALARRNLSSALVYAQKSMLRLGVSKIHGIGVFTTCRLPAETEIHVPMPVALPTDEKYMQLVPRDVRDTLAGWYDGNRNVLPRLGTCHVGLRCYLNHRQIPNATLDGDKLTITETVRKGAEVTIDYRTCNWPHIF